MATKWGVLSAGRIANDFVSVVQALPNNEHQVSDHGHNFEHVDLILI